MEYQKTTNLLDNEVTQPSKFRTKSWIEINDVPGMYNIYISLSCFDDSMEQKCCTDIKRKE